MTGSRSTLTFLLTDIEHSTALWDVDAEEMRLALIRHEKIICEHVSSNGGKVIKTRGEGDSHFVTFDSATQAISAALSIQQAMQHELWNTREPLRIRMSIHTGEVENRGGDFFGGTVNKAARLRGIAHGGQTLVSLATRELIYHSLPKGSWLSDLGEHRLKDLMRPEQVFQLCAEGLQNDFPPLNSLDAKKHNLPFSPNNFIGREDEMAHIEDKLRKSRLVTLLGPGGCGKTRLALQVAADLIDDYSDGAWIVDLAPIEDPTGVELALANVFQLALNPARRTWDDIAAFAPHKQFLLVMDNCEHLGKEPGRVIEQLLKVAPKVKVLATSRRSLNLVAESSHYVPPLSNPEQGASDLGSVIQCESVLLMVDRARARAPQFHLSDSNAAAVASLCTALEGMPLAIELAASRLRMMSPEQIYARLGKSLDVLKGGAEDGDERHRTLRATIDWSFAQLSVGERDLLKTLSLLPAGCTLEAAEAMTHLSLGDLELLDTLESLVDNCMLQVEQRKSPRYRMLESIRQYCLENVDAALCHKVNEKFANWVGSFVAEAKPHLHGPDQENWLAQIDDEYPNILAALSWACEQASTSGTPILLASNMDRYWYRRGLVAEGRKWLKNALDCDVTTPGVRATVLRSAGTFAWLQMDFEEGKRLISESLNIFRELDDQDGIAGALANLGALSAEMDDWQSSKSYFLEALVLAEKSANTNVIVTILQNLANLMTDQGNLEEAESYLAKAQLLVDTKCEDLYIGSMVHAKRARIERLRGLHTESSISLAKAMAGFKEVGAPPAMAQIALQMTELAFEEQHFEMSARLYGCISVLWESTNTRPDEKQIALMDRLYADLRERLDPKNLQDALAMGRNMNASQIADYAISGIQLIGAK